MTSSAVRLSCAVGLGLGSFQCAKKEMEPARTSATAPTSTSSPVEKPTSPPESSKTETKPDRTSSSAAQAAAGSPASDSSAPRASGQKTRGQPSTAPTVAEARRQLEQARKAAGEGDVARALKEAGAVLTEAQRHSGDSAWDSVRNAALKDLAAIEQQAASPERPDPSDSTPLILK
jgi:cytoskeletal protein RodZ